MRNNFFGVLIEMEKISIDRKIVLGKGGSANVFKGKYRDTPVAVKRIEQDPSKTAAEAAIEIREVENQRLLNHENVLKIYAVNEDDDFRLLSLLFSFIQIKYSYISLFYCMHV